MRQWLPVLRFAAARRAGEKEPADRGVPCGDRRAALVYGGGTALALHEIPY